MQILTPLNKYWQGRLRFRTMHGLPFFTDDGLCLGTGAVLVKGRQGRLGLAGSELRVLTLLRTALGRTIEPEILPHLGRACDAWNDGDETRALIHVAFARLPPLPDRAADRHLFLAAGLMDAGMSPLTMAKIAGFTEDGGIIWRKDYNPDQPRRPDGPGGGQWVREPQTEDMADESDVPAVLPQFYALATLDAQEAAEFLNPSENEAQTPPTRHDADTQKPKIIVMIGGYGDLSLGGSVLRYANTYKSNNKENLTVYFTHDDEDGIDRYLKEIPKNTGTNVDIICHSMGCNTAGNYILDNPGRITNLTMIDGVGSADNDDFQQIRNNVKQFTAVNAVGGADGSFGNVISGSAFLIGKRPYNDKPKPYAHYYLESHHNHDDFSEMMKELFGAISKDNFLTPPKPNQKPQ